MLVVMGIDVSKATLDAALYFPTTEKIRGHHKVSNDAEGIATLKTWSIQHAGGNAADVRVIIEATNTYHELATELLHAAGCTVVVANVKRVKRFRESLTHNKTDPADARTLALFGAMPCRQRHAWQPPPGLIASLRCLLRRLGAVNRDTHRELSRYKSLRKERAPKPVLDSFARMLVTQTQERRQLLADIRAHYRSIPALAEQIRLMRTMPAMGELSALFLACVMFSRTFRSARQVTAFLALTPVHTKSGESVEAPARLSGEGDRYVRAALYMAALCAIRINKRTLTAGNPAMRGVYDRLGATRPKQLRPKQRLIGVVRHMVSSEYGMLLHQLPFNPRLVSGVTLEDRKDILGVSEAYTRRPLPSLDSPPITAPVVSTSALETPTARPRTRRGIARKMAVRRRA